MDNQTITIITCAVLGLAIVAVVAWLAWEK